MAQHDQHKLEAVQAMDHSFTRLLNALDKIEKETNKGIDAAGVIILKVHAVPGQLGNKIHDRVEEIRQHLGKIYDILRKEEMTTAQREAFTALQKAAP